MNENDSGATKSGRFGERVVIVTGAASGIGRCVAEAFAAEGAHLALVDINGMGLEQVAGLLSRQGTQVCVAVADVAHGEPVTVAVEQIVRRFGRIDVLVNVAGICPFNDFFQVTPDEWDRVMATNCTSIFLMSQTVGARMRDTGGVIVNVTSISGEMVTNVQQVAYCTSKAAANMLTRMLAVALAPYRIRVNAVMPGTIPTAINAEVLARPGVRAAIEAATPLGTLGTGQDVAHAVLYLASDAANWITGALLAVDGGYLVNGTR